MHDGTGDRSCAGPDCGQSLRGRTSRARFCSQNCQKKARARIKRAGRVCVREGCQASLDHLHADATTCSRACLRFVTRARDPEKVRAQERASKARHPSAVKARKKAHYEANRDAISARSRAYYEAHRDEVAEQGRQRYTEHGPEIRARVAEYRRENRDKCSAWDARYRSRLREATVEVFDPVEIFERDGWVCGICRRPIDPEVRYPDQECASLDHVIPLSRDGVHSRDNAQASHLRCNKRKHARTA